MSAEVQVLVQSDPSGHQRMVELLGRKAAQGDKDNPYLGTAEVLALEFELGGLDASASAETRAQVNVNLGLARLRLGQLRPAIDNLLAGHRLLEQFPPESRGQAALSLNYYLALAYLRLGETENCVDSHSAASCLLPIRAEGVHQRQEGSRSAMPYLRRVLDDAPADSGARKAARWLLNIAYMTLGEYPSKVPPDVLIPARAFESDIEFPAFREISPGLGLNSFNMSGGAVVEDFDRDGFLDILTSEWGFRGQLLFFKAKGDGTFEDRTTGTGLDGIVGGLNMVSADYDNDGDVDILVLRGAWLYGETGRQPNSLLRNNGDGTFTDVTFEAGLGEVHYPTQTAAWGDFNNDGALDLYIGNEASPQQQFPSQLFRNNRDGTFTDVAKEAGVANLRYAKGVTWGDYDGDGDVDLYVSNLGMANRLYRNNGDGTFSDVAAASGVVGPKDSFATWFWDYDNDGILDLFVASYFQAVAPDRLAEVVDRYLGRDSRAEPPALYRGLGNGRFENVTRRANLLKPALTMGANFGDLNNDGFLDFYLGTGYPLYDGLVPNMMYLSQGGERFADVSTAGGFSHLQKGHAIAFADFDRDGDQDVFEEMGGAYPSEAYANVLYENPGFKNNWVKIRLVGRQTNRSGHGVRLTLSFNEGDKARQVVRHVGSVGSFGANPVEQHIGLGKAGKVERLEVFWPVSKTTQVFEDVEAGAVLEIEEGNGELKRIEQSTVPFKLGTSRHH